MKILIAILVAFGSSVSYAAEVRSAKLDAAKSEIVMDVVYGGGCGRHEFSLELKTCRESSPVSCVFLLKDKNNDFCEALISKTITISLASAKLDTEYFAGGTITILGDNKTSAKIKLPTSEPQDEFFEDSAEVSQGKFNLASSAIEFVAVHGGGCGEHKYSIQLEKCFETFPVQCEAIVKHLSNDRCEALISREVKISLEEAGLNSKYYSRGSLTIKGSNNSEVTVRLPEIK